MEGIIFDFNGTLVWDAAYHEQAWNIFFRDIRQTPLTRNVMNLHVFGRTNKAIVEYLLGRQATDAEVTAIADKKEEIYRNIASADPQNYRLAPGVTGLLNELKRRCIPRTIATASEKANVDFFIRYFHLGNWFDTDKIIYDDFTFPGKPAPDIFLRAAQAIGVPPRDCIVMEDSLSGIQAAQQANIGRIIAVNTNNYRSQLEKMNNIFQIIDSFDEFDLLKAFAK